MRAEQHHAQGAVVAEAAFARIPASVAMARSWAKEVYSRAGGVECDVCELLVSEVVTNAVQHAEGPLIEVRVMSSLWIEVWDGSSELPRRRATDGESVSGRGMEILDALAPGHEVLICPAGKRVRFQPKGW
ncbi:ATP-binding protein [Streptomyces jumonjinensis]|uniref:ATP-binding protein n=1 Tax=Streptomyces jumonjinensis TaxID=1945 RepID=UPI0037A309B4